MYRVLREAQQLVHRGRTAVPQLRATPSQAETGPNQVPSWDITYLKSPVRGVFWYRYLILDIWSRRIVGWTVEASESSAHSAALFRATCAASTHDPNGIALHADNGGPMKGATMLATLKRLGVLASFSRLGVSNDDPFSEALFRTAKYRPHFPREPVVDLAHASAWVAAFVQWTTTSIGTAPSGSSRSASGMTGSTSRSSPSAFAFMPTPKRSSPRAGAARRATGTHHGRCAEPTVCRQRGEHLVATHATTILPLTATVGPRNGLNVTSPGVKVMPVPGWRDGLVVTFFWQLGSTLPP